MAKFTWVMFCLIILDQEAIKILAEKSHELKTGNAKFAQEFYIQLRKFYTIESNFVYSPFSLSASVGLLAIGAEGKTLEELQNVMHFPTKEIEFLKEFNNLLVSLENSTDDATVRIANGIFPDLKFELDDEYIKKSHSYFKAAAMVQKVDYKNPTLATKQINKYVDQATEGTIKDIISSADYIDPSSTKLILVNALHFKSEWKDRFTMSRTKPLPFHLLSASNKQHVVVDVQMMNRIGQVLYAEINELDAQVLALPYQDPRFNMLIILPKTKDGITALEEKLGTINLGMLHTKLELEQVKIFLPKFRLENEINLYNPLIEAGIESIFEDADFGRITKQSTLRVDQIFQKVYLQVDELGTEPKVNTNRKALQEESKTAWDESTPVEFLADHPFILTLQYMSVANTERPYTKLNHGHIDTPKPIVQTPNENKTGTILFMGRLMNPNK